MCVCVIVSGRDDALGDFLLTAFDAARCLETNGADVSVAVSDSARYVKSVV